MISFRDFVRKSNKREDLPIDQSQEPEQIQGQQQQGQEQSQFPATQQQMQNQMQQNPFANSPYANVNLPDAPMQFGSSMADSLLSNDEVPEAVKKKHWFVFHKDNVLTFLDDERKQLKMLSFDILKIDMLNAMPYYDYTFEKEMELNVLRNVYDTKLDRALGTKNQVKNERTVLQSQFTEARQISEMEGSNIQQGFLRKLLGRR